MVNKRVGEPYENLAIAVVKEVTDELKSAYKTRVKNPNSIGTLSIIRKDEAWLRSAWGQTLCNGIDTEYIIRKLKEETGYGKR
jgi:hypothetical protein